MSFLSLSNKYNSGADDELIRISKMSNIAITIIWLSGLNSMLVFIFYFLFFPNNSNLAAKKSYKNVFEVNHVSDAIFFADKTTLVNIGLKIQASPGSTDIESNGSIGIHKIKYDRQLNKPMQPVKTGFYVKAIPK